MKLVRLKRTNDGAEIWLNPASITFVTARTGVWDQTMLWTSDHEGSYTVDGVPAAVVKAINQALKP